MDDLYTACRVRFGTHLDHQFVPLVFLILAKASRTLALASLIIDREQVT